MSSKSAKHDDSATTTKTNHTETKKKRSPLYAENVPTFYVGAGNNSEL
jgi:hypothetical protein